MSTTADVRIRELIYHFHTNVKAFSELCGYERPQAFYDILNGKTRAISSTMAERIRTAFPEINGVWLLTGTGNMLLTPEGTETQPSDEQAALKPAAAESAPAAAPDNAVRSIPLVETPALAGPLHAYLAEGCDLAGCKRFVTAIPTAEIAVPVSGDSMEPDFPNGSVVLLSKINERAFIPWGHTLVISTENGVFIKRIMPDAKDESYICAESINPRYPAMRIPKSSVFDMYRIVAMQRIMPTM